MSKAPAHKLTKIGFIYRDEPRNVQIKAEILRLLDIILIVHFLLIVAIGPIVKYYTHTDLFFLMDAAFAFLSLYLLYNKKFKWAYLLTINVLLLLLFRWGVLKNIQTRETFILFLLALTSIYTFSAIFIDKFRDYLYMLLYSFFLLIFYGAIATSRGVVWTNFKAEGFASLFIFSFCIFVITVTRGVFHKINDELRVLNKYLDDMVEQKTYALSKTVAELKQTRDQLIESEKLTSLGRLVAGIAHEINTPLGIGITGATHLEKETASVLAKYKEGSLTEAEFETYLATSSESSQIVSSALGRAGVLVASFKGLASDQSSSVCREFHLHEYISDILVSLKHKFKQTGHEIVVNCSNEITMNSFPGILVQIITNLIENSLNHAFSDQKKGTITITVNELAKSFVKINFSDNGCGIPPENLKKIYEPFFTTKRGQGGTGLGLNLVYNLITRDMGGTINCTSTVGSGTEFEIVLPKDVTNYLANFKKSAPL